MAVWEGRTDEVRALAQSFIATGSKFASVKALRTFSRAMRDREMVDRMSEAMRTAGLPEG